MFALIWLFMYAGEALAGQTGRNPDHAAVAATQKIFQKTDKKTCFII